MVAHVRLVSVVEARFVFIVSGVAVVQLVHLPPIEPLGAHTSYLQGTTNTKRLTKLFYAASVL